MKKVTVLPTGDGALIQVSRNPEYGWITVSQEREIYDDAGFLHLSTLFAYVKGRISDLQQLGWVAGQTVPGKILILEQLIPFNYREPEHDFKVAGDTGVVCCMDGQPIYRKVIYTADIQRQDTLIAHNNGADIRAAKRAARYLSENVQPVLEPVL